MTTKTQTEQRTLWEVVNDEHGAPIVANTPAWLVGRQSGLGASEAPTILDLSPWSTPREVALSKRATKITDEQTEAMEFGHLMEPVAREVFKRRHGNKENSRHKYLGEMIEAPGLIRSTRFPHLLASLDSVIVEPSGEHVPGQIKNVTEYKRAAWGDADGGLPDMVRMQVIQECIVFGSDHGWVLPIFGGNTMPEPIRVEADAEMVEWYAEYSAEWWRRYGPAGEELPDPTLGDDLSGIWPGVAGESVELSAETVEKIARLKRLKALAKRATEIGEALALDVKVEMGDATEALSVNPDKLADRKLVATWRPHKAPRKTFDHKGMLHDHPELKDTVDAYTTDGATPRPLLIK